MAGSQEWGRYSAADLAQWVAGVGAADAEHARVVLARWLWQGQHAVDALFALSRESVDCPDAVPETLRAAADCADAALEHLYRVAARLREVV